MTSFRVRRYVVEDKVVPMAEGTTGPLEQEHMSP